MTYSDHGRQMHSDLSSDSVRTDTPSELELMRMSVDVLDNMVIKDAMGALCYTLDEIHAIRILDYIEHLEVLIAAQRKALRDVPSVPLRRSLDEPEDEPIECRRCEGRKGDTHCPNCLGDGYITELS